MECHLNVVVCYVGLPLRRLGWKLWCVGLVVEESEGM